MEPGEIVHTFIGERLIEFKITEILDPLRLTGRNEAETYCVYRNYCYPTPEEAIEGMRLRLSVQEELWEEAHGGLT